MAWVFVQRQHAGVKPGGAWDQEFDALVLKPAGKTQMIGVVVRGDQPCHRLARQRHRHQPLPDRLGPFGGHAGVDQRPAVAIVKRIDVHMVKRYRQRQAQPFDAGRHVHRLELCRWVRKRIGNRLCHADRAAAVRS